MGEDRPSPLGASITFILSLHEASPTCGTLTPTARWSLGLKHFPVRPNVPKSCPALLLTRFHTAGLGRGLPPQRTGLEAQRAGLLSTSTQACRGPTRSPAPPCGLWARAPSWSLPGPPSGAPCLILWGAAVFKHPCFLTFEQRHM